MKKIGLIGGLTPEATMEYYKKINKQFFDQKNHFPELVIQSLDLYATVKLSENSDQSKFIKLFQEKIDQLETLGCEVLAITANTPHYIFNELKASPNTRMISIVEETAIEAKKISSNGRIGLVGTKSTMNKDFYHRCFEAYGLKIYTPEASEQEYINEIIYNELSKGIFSEMNRRKLESIALHMQEKVGIDSLILGCTELPLIMTSELQDLRYINTLEIHVNSIVKASFSDD